MNKGIFDFPTTPQVDEEGVAPSLQQIKCPQKSIVLTTARPKFPGWVPVTDIKPYKAWVFSSLLAKVLRLFSCNNIACKSLTS